ncbi:MAG: glycogen synthase GlgA [Methylophilaceae bacterium]
MNVLFATSEAFPLIKTGGLADVSGALPKALINLPDFEGDIKILIPGYTSVLEKLQSIKNVASVIALGQICTLVTGKMPSTEHGRELEVIAIQNAKLYERIGGPYNDENGVDWTDNALRFGVLSRIASLLCSKNSPLKNWQPDLIHCNDWQTGLAPTYMKLLDHSTTISLLSIHNIAFQGCFDAGWLKALELPLTNFNINGFEYHKQISFLKAGIFYADKLSTVSPTYAQEIQSSAFGFGLEGLLKTRRNDLTGILNGIDTHEWNPATDALLPKNFSAKDLTGKKIVKEELQQQLDLQIDENAPLLGVVSRLTHQKGLDLLPNIMPNLIESGCQFAILGSGEKTLEANFIALEEKYPTKVSVNTGYHEHLSHNIMAGADMFVMPSRFEPCGLNQLYGLAYGTPPIVTATGGLADSICDTNEMTLKNKTATGFVMENVTSASLLVTTQHAIALWKNKKNWRMVQDNGMKKRVDWASSANLYLKLYKNSLRELATKKLA